MTPPTTHAGTGESREGFMARVRRSLGRTGPSPAPPAPPTLDDSIVRLQAPGPPLGPVFLDRAAAVGMTVQRTTAELGHACITALLRERGLRRLVSSLDSSPHTSALHRRLALEGFELIEWQGTPGFGAHYDADAGITGVECAVAESGTLVCTSGPGRGRALSLVPPVHVAVVRASQIVPDLIDLWPSSAGPDGALPSSLVLITGPSKTADIEGILITGVHGPREVHVVLLEDC